jgi:glucan phosphoethanolaminetransferase (alkaline phosphatase superfamily)
MSQSLLQKRPHLIPAIIAAVMLFGALGRWPYGYYQLLRFVVCGVSVYVAYTAYTWQKMWAVWLFGFIAVLFNPLIPIHLSREAWQPINVICAILLIFIVVVLKNPSEKER